MAKLVMESLFESAAEEFHINSRFRSTLSNCFFQLSYCFFHNKLWNWDGRLSEETHLDSRERTDPSLSEHIAPQTKKPYQLLLSETCSVRVSYISIIPQATTTENHNLPLFCFP